MYEDLCNSFLKIEIKDFCMVIDDKIVWINCIDEFKIFIWFGLI